MLFKNFLRFKFYKIFLNKLIKVNTFIQIIKSKFLLNISFSFILIIIYKITSPKIDEIYTPVAEDQTIYLLWLNIILSLILFMENIFYEDYKCGRLDLYFLNPFYLEIIIIFKLIIYNFLYCLSIKIILNFYSFFFNFNIDFLHIIYLFNIIFTFNSFIMIITALLLNIKERIFLLYLLMIPLCLPFIIFYKYTNLYYLIYLLTFIINLFSPILISYIIKKNL